MPNREMSRGVSVVRLTVFSVLMVLIAGLLALIAGRPLVDLTLFDNPVVDRMVSYQLSALPGAGAALLVTFVFAGRVRLRYLSPSRTGVLHPLLPRGSRGSWESDGWTLGLIMTTIVATTTFFQFLPGGFAFQWLSLVLLVPLAAANAFTEEVIFRLPFVTMGDNDTRSRTYGLMMGSLVFGVFHYWGVAPSGLTGAIMSTLLGFILAKSMQETRGFFWAFTIHFMLDLGVLAIVLNQAP